MKTKKKTRILLKLSGEALSGNNGQGINIETINQIADDILAVYKQGIEIGLVIGGGNIFRGISAATQGMDRANSDYMGMLATIINALALQDALEKRKIPTRVQSAINVAQIAEPYVRRKAIRHIEKGRIVIFAAGTGNPYFTTDTAASLRAMEINANLILKATKVDGVYNKDPVKFKNAKKYKQLKYLDVINKKLKVMDSTSITLCMEHKIPILVFNLMKKGSLLKAVTTKNIGTIIS